MSIKISVWEENPTGFASKPKLTGKYPSIFILPDEIGNNLNA